MIVRKIMDKEPITVNLQSTIHEAARLMKERKIGSVLVTDAGLDLKGILTDRDIVVSIAAEGKDPKSEKVSQIMKTDLKTVEADVDIEDALNLMGESGVKRMPVLEKGKLAGVLSADDLAGVLRKEIDSFMSLSEKHIIH